MPNEKGLCFLYAPITCAPINFNNVFEQVELFCILFLIRLHFILYFDYTYNLTIDLSDAQRSGAISDTEDNKSYVLRLATHRQFFRCCKYL